MPQDIAKLQKNGLGRAAPQSRSHSDTTALSQFVVSTGARLHFGLFSTGEVNGCAFGGAGMMIDAPQTCVTAQPSDKFCVQRNESTLADRIARRIAESLDRPLPDISLEVQCLAPRHFGLGSGTQLSLCIAVQLAHAWGMELDGTHLASAAGRGKRSGIGVHGFDVGGLLVDAGKASDAPIAPIATRVEVPESWRVLLAWPGVSSQREHSTSATWAGACGAKESQAFGQLSNSSARLCTKLRDIAMNELVPAARSADFDAFSESVYRFNRLAGECFAPVQGGIYASPEIEELITQFRSLGIRGVGQSSWGPVVFAFLSDETAAAAVVEELRSCGSEAEVCLERIMTTRPRNCGYELRDFESLE